MQDMDISSLVVGSPPPIFDPNYNLPPPWEFEHLKEASESGDIDQVRKLSKSDKLSTNDLVYALTLAQQHGHMNVAAYLLDCGVPVQNYHVESAILSTDYQFLRLFLANSYDINEPITWNTPSLLIRSFHNQELCEWLLEHGADPNVRCALDITPLSIAVQEAPFDVIKLLFKHKSSIEYGQLLHYAVRRNTPDYLEVLNFILDKHPSINQVMFENNPTSYDLQKPFGIGTRLHEAVELGKVDVVETLLARGADPAVRDARGESAVDKAERNGISAIVDRLRHRGSVASESDQCHSV
ncbi:uncharacterized protein PGRI_002540 [Penicillium griseofulvum]|uniref:Uncharacterized protein n=1 Tax=Penicillium patulum TaxID=5078 RepID=A0A135LW62_PENPA|nr:uncharacterized protein PGRI_002540 [Penicillium griseofulvum]KXG53204.1 hypothetical protein PGRI_002540 [Penicillium griseofulvum]